jgi:type IV pilus assembly protein PilQ
VARRGVLVLLGCALTLTAVGTAPAGGADPTATGRPIVVAQARAPIIAQAAPAQQRPRLISLDFKDADINNILRILAEFSGLNIVTSDDVKGKVTVKLTNVPWQQALDSVVRAAKLAYVQEGNIIRVDKLENLTKEAEAGFKAEQREVEISQRRKEADLRLAEQERQAELSRREFDVRKGDLEELTAPLVEEIIPLKYAHVGPKRASQVDFLTEAVITVEEKGLEDAITGGEKKEPGKRAGLLSARGTLTIDQRTNSLIIRDIAPYVVQVREFVARFDRPTPGVLIEARIVEINKEDARNLGIVWGGAFTPRAGQNSPITTVRGSGTARGVGNPTSGQPTTAANFPAAGFQAPFTAGNLFGLTFGWLASNFALDLQLQALEGEGRAKIVSRPSALTLDNQPANIASGTKIPIISLQVVGGAQQASVTFQDVTTRLQVTPHVAGDDGQLLLSIGVKRDTLGPPVTAVGLTAFQVDTRQANTQVRIPDGGTVVLGGLREDNDTQISEGLPWLRKIPVLGWLFKNDNTSSTRRELMIFLTAKIVENPGQAAATPDAVPAVPGAPPPPGPTGQAPAPLPAVSAVVVPAGRPAAAEVRVGPSGER